MVKRAPLIVYSSFLAHKFWRRNVVNTIVKRFIGKKANPSILEYAPYPTVVMSPKILMYDYTSILANAMIEFCISEGSPRRVILFNISKSKQRSPMTRR